MSERKDKRKQIANKHILSLHESGLSVSDIAKETGKTKLNVKNTILRLGVDHD